MPKDYFCDYNFEHFLKQEAQCHPKQQRIAVKMKTGGSQGKRATQLWEMENAQDK